MIIKKLLQYLVTKKLENFEMEQTFIFWSFEKEF